MITATLIAGILLGLFCLATSAVGIANEADTRAMPMLWFAVACFVGSIIYTVACAVSIALLYR